MKRKMFVTMGCALALCLFVPAFTFAAEVSLGDIVPSMKRVVRTSEGKDVQVYVEGRAIGKVTGDDLQELVDDFDEDGVGRITVHDVVYADDAKDAVSARAGEAQGPPYVVSEKEHNKKKGKKKESKAKDEFVISVAKGQMVELGYRFSASLSASLSGGYHDYVRLNLAGKITCAISASSIYKGPPERSSENTRLYYIRFMEYSGKYVQYKKWPDGSTTETRSGTFKEPSRYFSVSVDKKI